MQIETSRGCAFSCSFCPREHKGYWTSLNLSSLKDLLSDLNQVFNQFPDFAKKIFIVDEEFFGYNSQTESRVIEIARDLQSSGFAFEISARLDQVYRPERGNDWNVRRLSVWLDLVNFGLERCLFGLESGVDSILERFKKGITKDQAEIAIRILSRAGIPIRLTYITFDPLMNMDELVQSFNFQTRKDLILKKASCLDPQEIIKSVLDHSSIDEFSSDTRLYVSFPYINVSLECLLGSSYSANMLSLGLVDSMNLFLGKMNVSYIDRRIGVLSQQCQLWLDKVFPLDYLLKSLIKITINPSRKRIEDIRLVIKSYSIRLLGAFLDIVLSQRGFELGDGDWERAHHCSRDGGFLENPSYGTLKESCFLFMEQHKMDLFVNRQRKVHQ